MPERRRTKLTVASVQATPVFMDKRGTIEKYCHYIEQAGREGARLVVTPETGIPTYPYWRNNFGYTSPDTVEAWRATVLEYYENSVRVPEDLEPLCRAARGANAYCAIGCSEQDDRRGSATLYNTMLFIGPRGEYMGRHRKLVPTHQERFFWGRGDASDLRVFETDIGVIGGLICFENHMTLMKAALAAKGEEIHCIGWPGYWGYGGPGLNVRDMSGEIPPYHRCDQDAACREYAFETQTFVISSSLFLPRSQVPDSFPFKDVANFDWAIGGSAIVNPFGMYLVEPVFKQETILFAEIDLADRIVAKNVFDCMGHYTRWDLVSLNVRDESWEPTRTLAHDGAPQGPHLRVGDLEEIAKRHKLPPDKVEAILRELTRRGVDAE